MGLNVEYQLIIFNGNDCSQLHTMRFKLLLFTIFLNLLSFNRAIAQSHIKDLTLEIYSDNDYYNILGPVTDKYYTNGLKVAINYTKTSPQNNFVSQLMFRFSNDSSKKISWALTQNMFTPTDITKDTVSAIDWPYSGALFLTYSLILSNAQKTICIKSDLQLGVLGPLSLVSETQIAYHGWLDFFPPKGWRTQIKNTPIVNYNVSIQPKLFANLNMELIGNFEVNVGTLMDQLRAGYQLKLGKLGDYSERKKTKTQIFLINTAQLGFVAYNIYLEGSIFEKTSQKNLEIEHTLPPSELNKIYFESTIGFDVMFKTYSFSYSQKYRTPQTKNTTSLLIGNFTLYLPI